MRIITSGSRYLDIDGYGGCVAYAELLNKQGTPAKAVSTAPFNESIPAIVRDWQAPLETIYTPQPGDTYTLIDVSEEAYFDRFVTADHIDEVIDHHPGLEDHWRERIGDGAIIEQVGAACTQIYEKWEQAGLADQISETSARLLMCGILDNTLNFGAAITDERDHQAYAELSKYAHLPADWPAQYFGACEQSIMRDLPKAVKNDMKVIDFETFPHTMALGQLAVWDAGSLAHEGFATYKSILGTEKPHWAINIIGISDNKSYLVTDHPDVRHWLEGLLGIHFAGTIAVADRTWLRKEIMKADQTKAAKER